MASRLETTRSLECQPLPPPRSQQWLLKEEAKKEPERAKAASKKQKCPESISYDRLFTV